MRSTEQNTIRFDGMNWGHINATIYEHTWIFDVGNYGGKPLVTSSESPPNKKTEIYDHESREWIESADYPWSSL